jgi:hypothetical protein
MTQFVTLKPVDDHPRWRVLAGGEDIGTVAYSDAAGNYEFIRSTTQPLEENVRRKVAQFLDTINE